MIVELHLLQNVSPSCLNRDDTNSPKDCEFGGHRRARVSSQCLKRSIRRHFMSTGLLPAENLSVRTKRLLDEAAAALVGLGHDEAAARRAVTAALASVQLKLDEGGETQYLLFLGRGEIRALVKVVAEHFDALAAVAAPENKPAPKPEEAAASEGKKAPKRSAKQEKAAARNAVPVEVSKAVNAVLDGGRAADLALFGRMLADLSERNIDAACQVAHALSTNRVAMEMDYYTAVDDLKESGDETGAGMIGSVEFNSSCFYRYASIDTRQLVENLGGDADLALRTVTAFLGAAVEAMPSGKQNSMAAHNPPSLVMAVVRESGQWNLANAFVRPVPGDGEGLVVNSTRALDQYWRRLTTMYGTPKNLTAAVATTEDGTLDALAPFKADSVAGVIGKVEQAIGFTRERASQEAR